jgi:PTH1 family peptidyl-tRNA hydrolase
MLLLVGLGNPGPKYERNRHNIGFMVVDEIVRRHSFATWRGRFQALTAEGYFGGKRVMVMKPTTFMNESGRAVGEAARFFKLNPEDVVVLHDELDLAFKKVRIKQGGGHAGHNGLRSIDAHIGNNYTRIRLGIGHPGDKARVHNHVLSDFAKVEEVDLLTLIDAIGHAAPMLANPNQHNTFMTKVALAIKPPPEKKLSKAEKENDDGI